MANRADERDKYLKEIRANFSPMLYNLLYLPSKFVIEMMFPQVSVEGLEHVKLAEEQGTAVYASNHKSYTDPCLLELVLQRAGTRKPFYSTGKNMFNFWSSIYFKNMGSFSIDRQNRSPAYLLAIKEYIHELLERKQNFVFFIEGGRSYDGKLNPPKLGILDAILSSQSKDVFIIPTALNYEQVLEDRVFARTKGKKGQRAFTNEVREMLDMFFNYYPDEKGRQRLYHTKGYVGFSKPIRVSEHSPDKKGLVELARRIMQGISDSKQFSSTSLCARRFLSDNGHAHASHALEKRITEGMEYFYSRGAIDGELEVKQPELLQYYANDIIDKAPAMLSV